MVLADAEDIEADLVGEFDFLHQVTHALLPGQVRRAFDKGVDAQFHVSLGAFTCHSPSICPESLLPHETAGRLVAGGDARDETRGSGP
jgi:hypothetical protein